MHVSGLFLCLNHNPKLDYTYKKKSDFGFLRTALQIGKAKRERKRIWQKLWD